MLYLLIFSFLNSISNVRIFLTTLPTNIIDSRIRIGILDKMDSLSLLEKYVLTYSTFVIDGRTMLTYCMKELDILHILM